MRRILAALSSSTFAVALALQVPAAAVTGFDSAYAGESAFLNLAPGASGTFTVFFANTGSTSWVRGTASQVDLAACLSDKVTCNAQDAPEAPFNSGWLSATRYATHTQTSVAPGSIGTFTYNVAAPAAASAGTYRFNGALVLSTSGADIHNEGYFQDVTVTAVTPTAAPVLTNISPTSGSVAGGTTMTITGSGFICTPSFPTVSFGGTPGMTVACGSTSLTVTTPAHAAGTVNVTISNLGSGPSNAASYTFVDLAAPQFSSVSATGNGITLTFDEPVCRIGALLVGDIAYTVNGGGQSNPQNVGGTITTSGLQTCVPSPPSGTNPSSAGTTSFTVFAQAPFIQNDTVSVTLFNTSGRLVDRSGNAATSFTRQASASADTTRPSIVSAVASGTNQVRLTYSELVMCNNAEPAQFSATPAGGTQMQAVGLACDAGPSGGSGGSTSVTVTFVSAVSPSGVGGTVTYNNSGTIANRIKDLVGNDATTPQSVSYGAFAPQAPTLVDTRLTASGGFSTQLDAGDTFRIAFSTKMNVSAPGSIVLRIRDTDGTTADISCATDATCQWNGADTTLGSVAYGFNEVLTVTLTSNPVALSGFTGTTPGLQLPASIIDSSGVRDPNDTGPDFANSPDRVIDVE